MGTIWQNLDVSEKLSAIQAVAEEYNIEEAAVEKDWWVMVVLKALFDAECGEYMLFRGGTSLSKGWNLINRFSEDIDVSIGRRFFASLNYSCANAETKTQIRNLREISRDYIHNVLSKELTANLVNMGIRDFTVRNITEAATRDGMKSIDHDADPTGIFVEYKSLFSTNNSGLESRIKIEITCMSMDESYEIRCLSTMIHNKFPDIDDSLTAEIKTVNPTRTFIEKVLMLNEEFQKNFPRHRRMSRHLYDLERIMDTEYGKTAIADTELYRAIVEHRRKFYHLKYVDYDKDYPEYVSFVPTGKLADDFRKDYEENMVRSYIYGNAISFEELIKRLEMLQERFRGIDIKV